MPASTAGEVTPLQLRPLVHRPFVYANVQGRPELAVEYAGAAPGLLAGVTQINVKLPETIAPSAEFPPGLLPVSIGTAGLSFYPGVVTIAVRPY